PEGERTRRPRRSSTRTVGTTPDAAQPDRSASQRANHEPASRERPPSRWYHPTTSRARVERIEAVSVGGASSESSNRRRAGRLRDRDIARKSGASQPDDEEG